MGNYISRRRTCAVTGKVILTDGTVHEFHHPLMVAELMLEHPQEFMVELRSVVVGHRPAPLPADLTLEMDKVYLMLPMKRGKTAVFSVDETRRIMDWARSALRPRSSPAAQCGMLCKLMVASATAAASHEKGVKHMPIRRGEGVEGNDDGDGEGVELLQECNWSRQLSGKGWKPALDTIKEKGCEKKIPHWLF
ncbi:hypothetical protein ACLOJK_026424 [Asimina triloba]